MKVMTFFSISTLNGKDTNLLELLQAGGIVFKTHWLWTGRLNHKWAQNLQSIENTWEQLDSYKPKNIASEH